MEQKKITVYGDEAELIRQADEIELRARAESAKREAVASKAHGRRLKDPMLLFENDEDARVVQQREALKQNYQQWYSLAFPPILTPAVPPTVPLTPYQAAQGTSETMCGYKPKREGPPLPEVLKNQFLQAVPTFRVDERLYLWEGNHFRCRSKNDVEARIKTVLRDNCYIANPGALLAGIRKMLLTEEKIIGEPDSHPSLVALRNGELDLRTMTLAPAMPAHRLTHYLDVPWLGPQQCPIFSSFLNEVTGGNPELSQRIIEAVGYLLVSDYGAKKFVVFQGVGDSGKSLLGNLISSFFLPGDCASLADFQFGERFALSSIANCQLCLSMDLPDGVIEGKAASVIKQITGGDVLSIEGKGKDAYTGHIRCKLLFGTNHAIRLKTRDHAFANRVLLIPFCYPVPPERQDRWLLEKLKAERSGILFRALHAYRSVIERGYQFTGEANFGFRPSSIVLEDTSANIVEEFVSQCCKLNQESFTPTEALHSAYTEFCNHIGRPRLQIERLSPAT